MAEKNWIAMVKEQRGLLFFIWKAFCGNYACRVHAGTLRQSDRSGSAYDTNLKRQMRERSRFLRNAATHFRILQNDMQHNCLIAG